MWSADHSLRNAALHEEQYTFMIISRSVLLRMKSVSDKSCIENQNTHFMFNKFYFPPKVVPLMKQRKKNTVERGKPHMTLRRTRFEYWIPKATNTHSEYVIYIACQRQQRLREGASMLRLYVHYVSFLQISNDRLIHNLKRATKYR